MTSVDLGPLTPLERAIVFATEKHSGQVDLIGAPYILHPLAVMGAGKNQYQRILGALHDVLEDTDTTIVEISRIFGEEVAVGVAFLTRNPGVPYGEFIATIRSEAEGDGFERARDVAAVKVHDCENNLSRIHNLPEPKGTRLGRRYRNAVDVLRPVMA